MPAVKKVVFVLILMFLFKVSGGQESPSDPVSYRLFSPFLFNPAVAGSKDFMSVDFVAGFHGKDYSQVLSANTRLLKRSPDYVSSSSASEFTNFGLGVSAFQEYNTLTRSSGVITSLSYHIPVDRSGLTFFSIGASAKGYFHHFKGDTSLDLGPEKFRHPDADIGIYYYTPDFYAGISMTNLFSSPPDRDTLNGYHNPVSRHYYFNAGYKFVLSRPLKIVMEPSVILVTGDTIHSDLKKLIKPGLKIYAGDFCIGTYINNFDNMSFFFQFRYPKFYAGTYFEFPRQTSFYKTSLRVEIAAGVNLWGNKSGYSERSRW